MLNSNENDDMSFAMLSAAEAIELIAHYVPDFTRETDRDSVASILRIISEYLKYHTNPIKDENEE